MGGTAGKLAVIEVTRFVKVDANPIAQAVGDFTLGVSEGKGRGGPV
jgi:hypothetical protein